MNLNISKSNKLQLLTFEIYSVDFDDDDDNSSGAPDTNNFDGGANYNGDMMLEASPTSDGDNSEWQRHQTCFLGRYKQVTTNHVQLLAPQRHLHAHENRQVASQA